MGNLAGGRRAARASVPHGGRLPYHPLIDALRGRLEQENAPEDLLDDVWLAELSRILPELRARYPDLAAPPGDEKGGRSGLFEAVARLGLALAARRSSIWMVDDVHWAVPGTTELLLYLIRRWQKQKAPILLLLLVRQEVALQEEAVQDAALREWLREVAGEGRLTRLRLAPVKQADLEQLAVYLSGGTRPVRESFRHGW